MDLTVACEGVSGLCVAFPMVYSELLTVLLGVLAVFVVFRVALRIVELLNPIG